MGELYDDMDELFRRAAENYPLKTDSSDWSKINNELHAADGAGSTTTGEAKKKSYRGLLWFTLLLFIPWICYRSITPLNNRINSITAKNNSVNAAIHKPEKEIQLNTNKEGKDNGINKKKTFNTIELESKRATTENAAQSHEVLIPFSQKNTASQQNTDQEVSSIVNSNNSSPAINDNSQVINNPLKDKNQPNREVDKFTFPTSGDNNTAVALAAKKKKGKTARVYIGVLAGVDISTIKFQSINNAGLNLGVLLGYQVNKTIAIETGIIWDKKFYYSKGKYFNTSKIYLPPNSTIDNVAGNCSMIELPLTIKYNLRSSGKTTWYSLTGVSSYLIKTENYDYVLNTGGVYSNRQRTYTNSSSNWLSVMNLSLGYSHTFGKRQTSNLRIEPYFKIPLQGMGIGSLPITSAGINIGLTKTIL
jgi:hypothetical protein